MRILGIDPGTATTGYSILDYEGSNEELSDIIDKYSPDHCAVEQLFFNTNTTTAIAVGQARGVILLCAFKKNLDIFEYTPLQVKMGVTGYGKAEKKQVQEMVRMILNLKEIIRPDDAADAAAIAICHSHSYRVGGIY
jgi:crossover junction endodeoxyribonuclease RuvC